MLAMIHANDKDYEIKYIFRRHQDSNEQFYLMLKERNRCDALVKNNEHYFLCNEISEAEITELSIEPIEPTEPLNELN